MGAKMEENKIMERMIQSACKAQMAKLIPRCNLGWNGRTFPFVESPLADPGLFYLNLELSVHLIIEMLSSALKLCSDYPYTEAGHLKS
jgi:hypothetical protein